MDSNITKKMTEQISRCARTNTLCDILAKEIGNPVAVALTSETIIGYSQSFSSDLIEEFTDSTKYMSEEEIDAMHISFDSFLKQGIPHVQAWPYLRNKQVNCGCLYNEVLMGVLIVPLINGALSSIELSIIEDAAKCFAIHLAINGYMTNKHTTPEQNFLVGLLNNEISSDLHRKRLPYIEINSIKSARILWIRPENDDVSVEYKIASLCKRIKNWWHVPYEKGYVILMDSKSETHIPKLEKLLKSIRSKACVSDLYTDITKTKSHLDDLISIMNFCLSYHVKDDLIYQNDYKLILALSFSRMHLPETCFTNEKLHRIREYDGDHSTTYMETLKAFMKTNRDYDEMSEILGIHKNTVFYRVNRLKELFDINFNDPLQTASLFFSMLADDRLL